MAQKTERLQNPTEPRDGLMLLHTQKTARSIRALILKSLFVKRRQSFCTPIKIASARK